MTQAAVNLFIGIQCACLIFCLVIFMKSGHHPLALILFYAVRIVFNHLVEKVCFSLNFSSLRILFLNMNTLLNRIVLCQALASEINLYSIMLTIAVDSMIVFGLIFFVSGPLHIHTDKNEYRLRTLFNCLFRRQDNGDENLTVQQKKDCVCERGKWVYFTLLYFVGEIIMPLWQTYFYFLISSTQIKSAFYNGFPLSNSTNLLIVSSILAFFGIINSMLFSYIERRKFEVYTPYRLMNVLVKKYNWLLALSVIATFMTLQCLLFVDCRFDLGDL